MQDRHPRDAQGPQAMQCTLALVHDGREGGGNDGRSSRDRREAGSRVGGGREVGNGDETGKVETAEDVHLRMDL